MHETQRGPRNSARVYTCKVAIEIIRRNFDAQYVDSAECRSRRTVEDVGVPVTV